MDTVCVCGDVKALVRHVWMDHRVAELDAEGDIVEVVESVGRRRDSISFTEGRRVSDARSRSVGPSKGGGRREFVSDRDSFEVLSRRRDA